MKSLNEKHNAIHKVNNEFDTKYGIEMKFVPWMYEHKEEHIEEFLKVFSFL